MFQPSPSEIVFSHILSKKNFKAYMISQKLLSCHIKIFKTSLVAKDTTYSTLQKLASFKTYY